MRVLKAALAHRPMLVLAALAGVLLVGGVSYWLTREVVDTPTVAAEPTPADARGPGWYKPLLEEEARTPRVDRTINGIRISPSQVPDEVAAIPCTRGEARNVAAGSATGTEVEIAPRYLPDGAALESEEAVECRSRVISANKEYLFPAGASSKFGGYVTISRRLGGRVVVGDVPDRARAASVLGRPSVIVTPLTDDGWGRSRIYIAEEWGITIVGATGLTEDELMRVAIGLYGSGGRP